jgi:ATP-dependent Clp protease protease subunit
MLLLYHFASKINNLKNKATSFYNSVDINRHKWYNNSKWTCSISIFREGFMMTKIYGMASKISDSYLPSITEEKKGHLISTDIMSKLVDERVVFITGEVNEEMATVVIAQLLYLDSIDSEKEINVYINSPGGEVDSGLAIYDTMQYIKSPVRTIAVGLAASMGAMILSGGADGKRMALPHANIMIHQPLGGAKGQQTDIEIVSNQIKKCRETLEQLLIEKSNGKLTKENINKNTERDNYLTPQEAIDLGIIDEIIMPGK